MKRKPISLEWTGDVDFPGRIEGERTADGEHQKVKLFIRLGNDAKSEVEVPLPVVPEWVHELLEEQFAREAA